MLGGAPAGMPPDRGMELELEMGGPSRAHDEADGPPIAPMPRSRPVKRLWESELAERRGHVPEAPLAEPRARLIDRLDRGRIQHSSEPGLQPQ